MEKSKTAAGWSDVKASLSGFDRAELLALVHSLYASSTDNKHFLHARFNLGSDALAPYKHTITRWLSPDLSRGQDVSVAKAKKAVADYKKALGQTAALAELMVFYCEEAAGFCNEVGMDDAPYLDALVRMYEAALKVGAALPEAEREPLWERLAWVQRASRNFGYGVPDDLEALASAYGLDCSGDDS